MRVSNKTKNGREVFVEFYNFSFHAVGETLKTEVASTAPFLTCDKWPFKQGNDVVNCIGEEFRSGFSEEGAME